MMRFNHMELTLPIGSLAAQARCEIDDFYGSVFGWSGLDTVVVNQSCHLLRLDEHTNQFILLAEHAKPMSSPSYDHLGLLQDTARRSTRCWPSAAGTSSVTPACRSTSTRTW